VLRMDGGCLNFWGLPRNLAGPASYGARWFIILEEPPNIDEFRYPVVSLQNEEGNNFPI